MSKEWIFADKKQVQMLRQKIIKNTDTYMSIPQLHGIYFLRAIKFEKLGFDPISEERTNFIEQVNQTFTYLVSLQAIDFLLEQFPNKRFKANFGVKAGYDIESIDGEVICECFAATTPNSNRKLQKDAERLDENTTAAYKYVIYYAEHDKPQYRNNIQGKNPNVIVIALTSII